MLDPEEISYLIRAVTGIIVAIIAALIYRHNVQKQTDTWISSFTEIHEEFWKDPIMAEVRYWFASDSGYEEIQPLLLKRRLIDEGNGKENTLTRDEYMHIESLDKFLNLVFRANAIGEHIRGEKFKASWQRMFGDYWIKVFFNEKRKELKWYVGRFYPELLDRSQIVNNEQNNVGPTKS